jgi:hypothetical protein
VAILTNKKGSSVLLHFVANATITVAGNDSVSNIAAPGEVLTGAYVKQAWWGCGNGAYWSVARGSNVITYHDSNGYQDYAGNGCAIKKDSAGTLVFTLNTSQTGFIMVEVHKEFAANNPADGY